MSELQQEGRSIHQDPELASYEPQIPVVADFILPLESSNLNDQCQTCSKNIRSCVKAAWAASEIDYTFSRTKLRPIQRILDEYRLRLDIWMSDCGVERGDLPNVTAGDESAIPTLLVELFQQLHQYSTVIFRGIKTIEAHSRTSIESSTSPTSPADVMNKAEVEILEACDSLASTLTELARLQSSIQMNSAVRLGSRSSGPEARLHTEVLNVRTAFLGQNADNLEYPPDSAMTEDTVSHDSDDEMCPNCHISFPRHALHLHTDFCRSPTKFESIPQPNMQNPTSVHSPKQLPSSVVNLKAANESTGEKSTAKDSQSKEKDTSRGNFGIGQLSPSKPLPMHRTSGPSRTMTKNESSEYIPSGSAIRSTEMKMFSYPSPWLHFSHIPFSEREQYLSSLSSHDRRKINDQLTRIARLRKDQDNDFSGPLRSSINSRYWWRKAEPRTPRGMPWTSEAPSIAAAEPGDMDHEENTNVLADAINNTSVKIIEIWDGFSYDEQSLEHYFRNYTIPLSIFLNHESREESPFSKDLGARDLRYIHIPANNMDWVEAIIADHFREERFDTRYAAAEFGVKQQHKVLSPAVWRDRQKSRDCAPFLKSGFLDLRGPRTNSKRGSYICLFMPFLHWETTDKWVMIENKIRKLSRPGFRTFLDVAETSVNKPSPLQVRSGLGRFLFLAAGLYKKLQFANDEALLDKYLNSDSPLHPRRTLAQYSLGGTTDTRIYDQNQILLQQDTRRRQILNSCLRNAKNETQDKSIVKATSRAEGYTPVERLFVVDQLWMWILDENTIVTSFSGEAGFEGESSVHESIREHLNDIFKNGHHQIGSFNVYDLANIIIDHCSGALFDQRHLPDQTPDPIEIYARALGSLSYKLEVLKECFKLRPRHDPRSILKRLNNSDPSLDFKLVDDIQSVVRELDSMHDVLVAQSLVLRQFEDWATYGGLVASQDISAPLNKFNESRSWTRRRSSSPNSRDSDGNPYINFEEGWNRKGKDRKFELDALLRSLSQTSTGVRNRDGDLNLLSYKAQKLLEQMLMCYNFKKDQARMSESQATIQAAESARKKQQNSIAVLTTAALIFFPLIYLTLTVHITKPIDLAIILPVACTVFIIGASLTFFSDILRANSPVRLSMLKKARERRMAHEAPKKRSMREKVSVGTPRANWKFETRGKDIEKGIP